MAPFLEGGSFSFPPSRSSPWKQQSEKKTTAWDSVTIRIDIKNFILMRWSEVDIVHKARGKAKAKHQKLRNFFSTNKKSDFFSFGFLFVFFLMNFQEKKKENKKEKCYYEQVFLPGTSGGCFLFWKKFQNLAMFCKENIKKFKQYLESLHNNVFYQSFGVCLLSKCRHGKFLYVLKLNSFSCFLSIKDSKEMKFLFTTKLFWRLFEGWTCTYWVMNLLKLHIHTDVFHDELSTKRIFYWITLRRCYVIYLHWFCKAFLSCGRNFFEVERS